MIPAAIPKRYARAILAAALDQKPALDIEILTTQLSAVAAHLEEGSPLNRFLADVFVPADRKSAVLESIMAKAGLLPLTVTFLRLLASRNRLLALPAIARELRRQADDREGIVRGEVLVAAELPAETLSTLRDRLSAALAKKVILTVRHDPAIIGGLAVKIGSISFNGSIRAHLDRLRETLSERVKF